MNTPFHAVEIQMHAAVVWILLFLLVINPGDSLETPARGRDST